MQQQHPISFYSSKISPRMAKASTYAKKLYAIVQAVGKWHHYLLGRRFVIKTDHKNLKNLLSQVIQTPEQQAFLYKLLGFDYVIEYKPGVENRAADALSRVELVDELPREGTLCAFSIQVNELLDLVRKENVSHPLAVEMRQKIAKGKVNSDFTNKNRRVYHPINRGSLEELREG